MARTGIPLAALALAVSQAAVAADFSANLGFMSEYIFRGISQSDSSAYGGLDMEAGGFYAGTWAADVDQGLEYDLYAGYGGDYGDFRYGLGWTGYFYTDDFDDTYNELNASIGWKWLSLEYAAGRYDNFDGPTLDYGYWAASGEYEGFYLKFAGFTQDFDGDYVEAGWGTEVAELEVSIAAIYSDEDLAGGESGETSLAFTVGKSFGLGGE